MKLSEALFDAPQDEIPYTGQPTHRGYFVVQEPEPTLTRATNWIRRHSEPPEGEEGKDMHTFEQVLWLAAIFVLVLVWYEILSR